MARSPQVFTFTMRPVVFIRIVGTNITAHGVFHCVHFQAPAMSLHRGRRGESWSAKSSQDGMESLDGEAVDQREELSRCRVELL